ncbi:polysaccharide deacetylase family protein [Patescibacteria group bacterium]|nr:polysaccharide deacetylase family protein [Patescibacteria group bacterium]MBU4017331.1 polysaccharide deacetylase family protein [Patescibacteria group bacterium]MBU4098727.1 polysaccharide deacetylase family protein [Patescibacteria group bacterium]
MKSLGRQSIIVSVLLFFVSYYFFFAASRTSAYNNLFYDLSTCSEKNYFHVLNLSQEYYSSNKNSLFSFKNYPLALKVSPTPLPTSIPKLPVRFPVVNAQDNRANDFCLRVPILLYHHIEPMPIAEKTGHAQLTVDSDFFDKQMAYLVTSGYKSISADELVDALVHHRGLPAKSIVITFDDGYGDNYIYAFEILKKYNIIGNFMIPTGLVENEGYVTWDQLREINGNSLMHIYNHTWSHAFLGGAAKDKIEYEIATANTQLESNLGKQIKIFTYPYGSFDQVVIDVLRKHGFTAAFSTINGSMQCESYIYALRRTHIGNAPLSYYGF